MATLGHTLRSIHGLPVGHCPADASTERRLATGRQRLAEGLVTTDTLDPAYQRHVPVALFDRLLGMVGQPDGDAPSTAQLADAVVIHGSFTLDAVRLEATASGPTPIAVTDWELAGVGDRYGDLATMARDLTHTIGPEPVVLFFEAYGLAHPDPLHLDVHVLLDNFLR